MPQALPIILAVAGLAGTGISIGESLANKPSYPKVAPSTPTTPAGPSKDQIVSAATPQALTIESLTGGSVSPEYLSTVAPLLAGVAGQPNTPSAMAQILAQLGQGGTGGSVGGGSAPFTPSGVPTNLSTLAGTPGLSDYLQKISSSIG